jgi:hypothetical protein
MSSPRPRKTLMVFGIGKLGGPVTDLLSRLHPDCRFVMVSRSRERSEKRANLTRYLAAQWMLFPEVIGEGADLLDQEGTSDLVRRHSPDIVFNATTPFPWWKIDALPERERTLANKAGPGMWCALDCLLPLALTRAIGASGMSPIHVNGCYPDMTNRFLASERHAPRLGIGNISNLVPGLTLAFAEVLNRRPADIGVQLVGHHYVSWNAPTPAGCANAPYHLTVTHPGGSLRFRGPDDSPFRELRARATRVRGLDGLGVTIGSACTLLDELLGGSRRRHHSPGALGLAGGYPVRIGEDGSPCLDLDPSLTPQDAIDINERAQEFDGIESVTPGSVLATPLAREAHREIVGIELPEIQTAAVVDFASEEVRRLEAKYGLGLSAA